VYKPVIGPHAFVQRPTKEVSEPYAQPCMVVAVFENGTVNLVAWDEDGKQVFVKGAVLVQATDFVPCHYTEGEP
jgi:hypothetical protein